MYAHPLLCQCQSKSLQRALKLLIDEEFRAHQAQTKGRWRLVGERFFQNQLTVQARAQFVDQTAFIDLVRLIS